MPTVNDANGTPMRVGGHGFAMAYVSSMSMAAHAGDDGDAFTYVHAVDPNVAGDIVYFKNSDDKTLRIYKIVAHTSGTGGLLTIKTGVTGTATGGTEVTPVNARVGSGSEASGTFYTNDGAQDMALTGGDTFDVLLLRGGSVVDEYDYPGELALNKNQTMVIANSADPVGAVLYITVHFYYHEKVE